MSQPFLLPLDYLTLTQHEDHVTGSYSYRKAAGTLVATVSGSTLNYTWSSKAETNKGSITLSSDGKVFNGWTNSKAKYHNLFSGRRK